LIIDGYTTPGTQRETVLSATDLLQQMDNVGVERAVIAPEDREIAVDHESGNNRMIKMARNSADRLIAACSVSPWHADAPKKLVAAAGRGAKMLVLAPMLQGFIPADDLVRPLLEQVGELGLPVYFHTGPHTGGSPAQVAIVAEQHPKTRFILAHGGSTDHAWDMLAVLRRHALTNLWYELSLVRPWSVPGYLELVGPNRLIFASSAPRNDLGFELKQFDQYVPIKDYPQIYGGNIAGLLEGSAT